MRKRLAILIGACLLASSAALAWNPVFELSPDKKEELDKAGVDVKYMITQNDPDNLEYHFVVTIRVPERPASSSIGTSHEIRQDDKLISSASWQATKGLCTATFGMSKGLLTNSILRIQTWYTNKHGTRVASGGYTLKPGEFAKHKQYNQLIQESKGTDKKVQQTDAHDKK